jgi:hypothetical protein
MTLQRLSQLTEGAAAETASATAEVQSSAVPEEEVPQEGQKGNGGGQGQGTGARPAQGLAMGGYIVEVPTSNMLPLGRGRGTSGGRGAACRGAGPPHGGHPQETAAPLIKDRDGNQSLHSVPAAKRRLEEVDPEAMKESPRKKAAAAKEYQDPFQDTTPIAHIETQGMTDLAPAASLVSTPAVLPVPLMQGVFLMSCDWPLLTCLPVTDSVRQILLVPAITVPTMQNTPRMSIVRAGSAVPSTATFVSSSAAPTVSAITPSPALTHRPVRIPPTPPGLPPTAQVQLGSVPERLAVAQGAPSTPTPQGGPRVVLAGLPPPLNLKRNKNQYAAPAPRPTVPQWVSDKIHELESVTRSSALKSTHDAAVMRGMDDRLAAAIGKLTVVQDELQACRALVDEQQVAIEELQKGGVVSNGDSMASRQKGARDNNMNVSKH